MQQDTVLAGAEFDPAVKKYWSVTAIIVCVLTGVGILLLPVVWIAVAVLGQRILDAMSAELFERKLVVKRGIFFKVEKSIPLEKITDVGLTQGPLMRAFDLYRLDFETAGQSGPSALVSMLGIVDAKGLRETILAQKDRLQFDAPAADAAPDQMSELLASVQRIEKLLSEKYSP